MPVVYRVKLDASKLREQLQAMLASGEDMRPFENRLGAWMLKSVDKNFRARGRPTKWKELAPYTLAMRRWRAEKFGRPAYTEKILEVRGELRRNWEFRVRRVGKGQEQLEVGTPTPKADVHHEGKTVPAPERWKTRTSVKMPKRVLIAIHPEDWRQAGKFADEHLRKVVPPGA